jgi:ATP-dependent RNA helicase RhlE
MHSKHRNIETSPESEPDDGFDSFDLAGPLRRAVAEAGYKTPTPIQSVAIPLIMKGSDLIGCAQTGTGKTAAFALPILHLLMEGERRRKPCIRALVVAPTRELAAQIAASFTTYGKRASLQTTVVFGGVKKGPQVRALAQKPAILVATPGRLLDLLSDRALSLAEVEYVVLDEADRMLDMGFIHDVQRIMKAVPAKRQTLLFSATMPREIEKLAAQFLDNPKRVAAEPTLASSGPITQSVHFVEKQQKTDLLIRTLRNDLQALVFTRTKHGANKVVRKLASAGIGAAAIHGNKSQAARESALAAFKSGRTRIVVATDLASRGLDIKELPLVINFDLPNEPEVYIHRIGRTGRAGAVGEAVSFCSRDELPFLSSIERLTRHRINRVGTQPKDTAAATTPGHETQKPRPTQSKRPLRHGERERSKRTEASTSAATPRSPRGPRDRRRSNDIERRPPGRARRSENRPAGNRY